MQRLFKNKKGVAELSIAIVIILIFVLLGVTLPFINDTYDADTGVYDADNLADEVSQDAGDLNAVSALDIALSVAKMFFWTFGELPFWLDAIFIVLRIALLLILIQFIPFVG